MKKTLGKFITFVFISNASINTVLLSEQPESYDDDSMFIKNITLSDWLEKPQTVDTMTRIIKIFNKRAATGLKNENIWVNGSPADTVDSIMANSLISKNPRNPTFQHICNSYPFIPYLVKWVIPQNNQYLTIGDLHGNFQALKHIINYINSPKVLKDANEWNLCDNINIIFLGDYMDRGDDSLNVFTTAALLSLKNPGQVLMLRGNHETIEDNLNLYGLYNEIISKLDPEIKNDEIATHEKTVAIIDELSKAYEFLPVGAFIGYMGTLPTKFNFHAHGCIDPRINYTDILDFDAKNLSENGGAALWYIDPQNIMTLEKLSFFYNDIVQDSFNLLLNFSDELNNPNPTLGFLWHDITWGHGPEFIKSTRGNLCSPKLNANFVKRFVAKFDSATSEICEITRSHQHNLPKELASSPHEQASLSCVIIDGEPIVARLLEPGKPVNFENNFGIITILSASIKYPNTEIKYPPTFLITSCGRNGTPTSLAFS